MDQKEKDEIIARLLERGATLPCPRCRNEQFTLLDHYTSQPLQEKPVGLVLGGPIVPSVITACSRCGYLSLHALGALGLLPPSEKKDGQ